MKIAIVDDEQGQRDFIKNILRNYTNFEIAGEAQNVLQAIALIQDTLPDIVLLDIEMPDGTGFDVLKACQHLGFQVIFATAHNEFAVKAFKFSALDYLLKPIDPEELIISLQKAEKVQKNYKTQLQLSMLLNNMENFRNEIKKIILKDANNIHVVSLNEVLYLEADNNYTSFFLTENRKIIVSKTLKEYEQLLEEQGFFRSHQSYIINLSYLKRIDKRDGGSVVLKDDIYLPLSNRRKEILIKTLEK